MIARPRYVGAPDARKNIFAISPCLFVIYFSKISERFILFFSCRFVRACQNSA